MFRRQPAAALLILALVAACSTPAASVGPTVSGTPSASVASPTASPSAAPSTAVPTPSPTASPTLNPATPSPTVAPPSPAPTPVPTMIVRAYFLLDDQAGGHRTLVPVLRTVPRSTATAKAAMIALLDGPTAHERAASPRISTSIPAATKLLSVKVSHQTATIDLSKAFVDSVVSKVVRARLAQVVYTLTQYPGVEFVEFLVEGRPIATSGPVWFDYDAVLTRVGFRDDLLPAIFVDRPAWGAGYPSGSHITGIADVFEAQFRIALRARDGSVLADRTVKTACGDGCESDFDVTLSYDVHAAQWGTLRVWDTSEADGSTIARRDYPVYLRP